MGLEEYNDVFVIPGRKLGGQVACPACLGKGSSQQACPATHFQRETCGTRKNGNDQRGQKQHKERSEQPPALTRTHRAESGLLLPTAVRGKRTMGRGKELRASWRERSTESRKDLEAERAREDDLSPCSLPGMRL